MSEISNLIYHIKNPTDRKLVDLRDYIDDLMFAVNHFDGCWLAAVAEDFYVIEVNTDVVRPNRAVRAIGRRIAKTSLKQYVRHRGKSKKGVAKNELFIRKKKLSKKQKNTPFIEIPYEQVYDPFYDPTK